MNKSLLSQAQELKAKLEKVQQELSNTTLEAQSGKGAVKVTINGQQEIQSIKISPKVINPDNAELLEELVLKAVNEAIAKSQKLAAKRLGRLTGGLKIPGLT
ncbi:YbaB/EbfC family nucleoid-associated protein [Dehalococcoidales bacterium]|nr:YbaB/EbfC family nucleoid-associated protein [Dehalococcoidales bacterium]MCL0094763.1 YbaB/EbfC family nucleoid-associated protein [Dehalococcoidales bacterium]